MFPREHGAYGQLLFPLATALAIGRPGRGAVLLVVSALCAFLAHEPLLVLLGQRGVRAAREHGAQARRWFVSFALAAALCGVGAFVTISPVARLACIVPAALTLVLGALILSHREHTTFGEVMAAALLSSIAAPVAFASGASTKAALTCAVAFAAVFMAGTLSVRAVIMCTRQPPATRSRVSAALVSVVFVTVIGWLSRAGVMAAAGLLAALPMCGLACALVALPPSARHLRRVGWALVSSTIATAGILIGLLR